MRVVTSPAGSATRPASEDAGSATSAEPSPQPSPTGRGGAEPTPTGQRGALIATLDPALDPDRHAVRGPVTVIFDRPVNATIHTRPLTFSPAIRGTFAWNADATAVTFTPTGHFRTATTYTVGVDDELRGRDGATFAAPPTWSLYVVTPPQVSRRAPMTTKGSDRQPEFRLTFNRPLDTASVAAALSVAPDVALDLTWDGDELLLRPAALLDPGVRYEFTLSETAADTTGMPFAQPFAFAYTPTPIIAQISGPSRQLPYAPLRLVFGYPMSRAAQDALTVEPPLAGEWRWQSDTELVMDNVGLMGNVTYRFGFRADPPAADGTRLPAPDRPFTFTAPSPLRAVTPSGQRVHTAAPLRLAFSRAMGQTDTVAAVTIDPATEGNFAWDGNTLVFTPAAGWLPLTSYTVTLGTAATDPLGRPALGQPVVHTFKTGNESALADFGIGPQVQVVDADGRRAVQFQSSVADPVALGFDLLPIDETGLINRLSGDVTTYWTEAAEPISAGGLSPVLSWTTTTTRGNDDQWGNPQATTLPAEAAPGLYLLRLTGGPTDQHLILALSRHTLVAKLAAEQIVVWVSDSPSHGRTAQPDGAPEGGPVPGAAVRVYARNGRLLAEGATDERGVARLALPADDEPYTCLLYTSDAADE